MECRRCRCIPSPGYRRHWIVLNEPNSLALRGYGMGVHAPGLRSPEGVFAAMHHQNLAQGLAFQALRANLRDARIGTTINLQPIRPAGPRDEDRKAAGLVDMLWNRAFLDPLYGHGYPEPLDHSLASLVQPGDMDVIAAKPDFLGMNYYSRIYVRANPSVPFGVEQAEPPADLPRTAYFQVEPDGMTEMLLRLHRDYGAPEIYITETGFAPTVLSLASVPIPSYMQGQAFLGPARAPTPRRYVFAARDRMDSEYDRVRMVRDQRFRYLYNYMPERPYYQPIRFRESMPMMRDILRLKDEGKLPPVTAAWFGPKPVEELYDADRDPWELHNLANDPRYRAKLDELRAAFHTWTDRYGDMGGIPEPEMISRMWLGGAAPPATAMPEIRPAPGGVTIACATRGASIGYWIERRDDPAPRLTHTVLSWDFERLAGEMLPPKLGARFAHLGDQRPAPQAWSVYDAGRVIPLSPGDTLHVNAMRIGYTAAKLAYPFPQTEARR
ncbi:hypothetical protein B7G54_05455 [Burkholderia puraquae]|uniref:6-phospho-beta-galactosidase n=1 Tax=Burkholderia puraquae TaxID=1904757 RepID=A0A1X1PNQ3_9BURK|nr:hypothetical protein B7G54_05455 [Burkholderia puraquae]